jgi:hypothetical protein
MWMFLSVGYLLGAQFRPWDLKIFYARPKFQFKKLRPKKTIEEIK